MRGPEREFYGEPGTDPDPGSTSGEEIRHKPACARREKCFLRPNRYPPIQANPLSISTRAWVSRNYARRYSRDDLQFARLCQGELQAALASTGTLHRLLPLAQRQAGIPNLRREKHAR